MIKYIKSNYFYKIPGFYILGNDENNLQLYDENFKYIKSLDSTESNIIKLAFNNESQGATYNKNSIKYYRNNPYKQYRAILYGNIIPYDNNILFITLDSSLNKANIYNFDKNTYTFSNVFELQNVVNLSIEIDSDNTIYIFPSYKFPSGRTDYTFTIYKNFASYLDYTSTQNEGSQFYIQDNMAAFFDETSENVLIYDLNTKNILYNIPLVYDSTSFTDVKQIDYVLSNAILDNTGDLLYLTFKTSFISDASDDYEGSPNTIIFTYDKTKNALILYETEYIDIIFIVMDNDGRKYYQSYQPSYIKYIPFKFRLQNKIDSQIYDEIKIYDDTYSIGSNPVVRDPNYSYSLNLIGIDSTNFYFDENDMIFSMDIYELFYVEPSVSLTDNTLRITISCKICKEYFSQINGYNDATNLQNLIVEIYIKNIKKIEVNLDIHNDVVIEEDISDYIYKLNGNIEVEINLKNAPNIFYNV